MDRWSAVAKVIAEERFAGSPFFFEKGVRLRARILDNNIGFKNNRQLLDLNTDPFFLRGTRVSFYPSY